MKHSQLLDGSRLQSTPKVSLIAYPPPYQLPTQPLLVPIGRVGTALLLEFLLAFSLFSQCRADFVVWIS